MQTVEKGSEPGSHPQPQPRASDCLSTPVDRDRTAAMGVAGRVIERLRQSRVFTAAAWSTMAFVAGQVLRIGGNLVMTRLLAPEMFGIMGLVIVVQTTLALLSDVGVRVVVVQSARGAQTELLNTVWTLEILRGLATWIVAVTIALAMQSTAVGGLLPAGVAWGAPDLPLVLAVATLTSIIVGFQSTNMMLATRNLDARGVATIEFVSQVAGLVVMVAVGLLTRSIWALVAGNLVSAVISTVASHLWLPGQRNRLAWDKPSIHEIFKTGRWILLSSVIFVLASNADRYILAGYINTTEFGLYVLALNLLLMVETVASRVFLTAFLPSLSETARDARADFAVKLFRLRLPVDLSFLSIAGFLYVTAPAIIAILYDDRYLAAGMMLQLLSFSLLFSRYGVLNMAYVALGRAELMASVHAVKLVASLVFLFVGFNLFGLTGGLIAVACHAAVPVAHMLWLNRALRLNDFRYEALVLLAWPAGYLAGRVCLGAFSYLQIWLGWHP